MGMTYVASEGKIFYTDSQDYSDAQGDCSLPGNPPALGSFDPTTLSPIGGLWYLQTGATTQHPYQSLRYIMEVPEPWKTSIGNNFLASGRHRGWCLEGSHIYASAPGNPAADSTVTAVKLLEFGPFVADSPYPWNPAWHYPKEHSLANAYQGAVWLTTGSTAAVVLSGIIDNDPASSYYGYAGWVLPSQCEPTESCPPGGRGWRAAEPQPALLLYDPDDLVDVYTSTQSTWEPQWYAKVDLSPYMRRSYAPTYLTTGADAEVLLPTFDRAHGLLYISESFADGILPLVHVFSVDAPAMGGAGGVIHGATLQGGELR